MNGELINPTVRTFEADIPISGPLDVPFEDFPANIQDGIYAAMERLSQEHRIPLTIAHCEYKTDFDLDPEAPGYHFLHIILSEVVMATDAQAVERGWKF